MPVAVILNVAVLPEHKVCVAMGWVVIAGCSLTVITTWSDPVDEEQLPDAVFVVAVRVTVPDDTLGVYVKFVG